MGKEKLIFSSIEGSINSIVAERILKRAYSQMGIKIEIYPMPGERALFSSNNGQVDGELFRIKDIHKKYNNLIMIPVPINYLIGRAFTKNFKKFLINGPNSFKGYKVGIHRGTKFAENYTKNISRSFVNKNIQLFKKLKFNRIDFAIVAELNGIKEMAKLGHKDIVALDPPVVKKKLYHYLHKRNSSLVPKLTSILKALKKEGIFEEIRKQVIMEIRK